MNPLKCRSLWFHLLNSSGFVLVALDYCKRSRIQRKKNGMADVTKMSLTSEPREMWRVPATEQSAVQMNIQLNGKLSNFAEH